MSRLTLQSSSRGTLTKQKRGKIRLGGGGGHTNDWRLYLLICGCTVAGVLLIYGLFKLRVHWSDIKEKMEKRRERKEAAKNVSTPEPEVHTVCAEEGRVQG
ncbi:hypothetical protein CC86DRAFT_411329 [Ophiobolus disseminans]|uniref:Uncharacterized protein n=1 Tax=Ophiobolus disseminans TaxID=1469910 RepID=A0A6A6ZJU9_9PLEO|nr:hypothetical protein CC86DRAFT_411329 [Ophiobolus disseminans]